ncbi:MAG: nuclear transport factor 2 family protein, partial [Eudoraea sp.]|nr:nuclear transport factor 2 family protein [Eudoraea sp.]
MKLTKAKQKLLDEAYNTVIQVCLFDRPLEEMTPLLAEDVMNFGAGKNELTKSKAAFLKQIKNQKKLAEGLKMDFAFTPVLRKVMNQGNGAIYTDDIVNTVWVNQIKNELKFRISFIFEYRDGRWLLIHSHTSTPDPQRADDEVWPIEDLKKRTEFLEKSLEEKMAELQDKNRELEVEAALERVRSKTMAMHNSQEVGATVVTLFDEVMKLGLDKSLRCGIGILEGTEHMETWSTNYSPSGKVDLKMGMLNMTIHPMLVGLKKAWKSKKKGYTYDFIGKDVIKYYTALNKEPEYPFNADLKTLPENVYHNSFFYSSGILFAFTENPISKEGAKVLNRFAKVFGQTYRRYLDLQKAEKQAREAIIESALERVRASSMAMHKSEQLPETSQVLFEQFALLGNLPDRISICIIKEEENLIELWATDQIGSQLDHRYRGSLEEATTMSKVH